VFFTKAVPMIRLAVFTAYKLFYFVTTLIELISNSLKAKS